MIRKKENYTGNNENTTDSNKYVDKHMWQGTKKDSVSLSYGFINYKLL